MVSFIKELRRQKASLSRMTLPADFNANENGCFLSSNSATKLPKVPIKPDDLFTAGEIDKTKRVPSPGTAEHVFFWLHFQSSLQDDEVYSTLLTQR